MERTNDSMSAESMIADSSLPDRSELKDNTSTAYAPYAPDQAQAKRVIGFG